MVGPSHGHSSSTGAAAELISKLIDGHCPRESMRSCFACFARACRV